MVRKFVGVIGVGLAAALTLSGCGGGAAPEAGTGVYLEPETGNYPELPEGDGTSVDDGTIRPLPAVPEELPNRWVPLPDQFADAHQLVDAITVGWNLGNTLDSDIGTSPASIRHNNPQRQETHWNNVVTTEDLILMVRDAGFNAVRIPVTWFSMMDEDGNIREDWFERVHEVVDYAYQNGMIVILNSHHDEPLWNLFDDGRSDALAAIENQWRQIATRFEPYGQRLIFEGLNEPRTIGSEAEWSGGTPEERNNLNLMQQTFVDTVRATCPENTDNLTGEAGWAICEGTNNWNRFLIATPYAASATVPATEGLVIPTDPAGPDKIIVSIHMYAPHEFALANDGIAEWSVDGEGPAGPDAIVDGLTRAHDLFVANGYPVIFGEMGAQNRDNNEARMAWADFYIRTARELGIRTFWWDNGSIGVRTGTGSGNEAFALFNRRLLTPTQPALINAIMQAVEATP